MVLALPVWLLLSVGSAAWRPSISLLQTSPALRSAQRPPISAQLGSEGYGQPQPGYGEPQQGEHVIPSELILTIGGARFNLTSWARLHPGGVAVLREHAGRDATAAFVAAHHSVGAVRLLDRFRIADELSDSADGSAAPLGSGVQPLGKLFTREDTRNTHKVLGVAALAHFAYRYARLCAHPMAGFEATSTFNALGAAVLHCLLSVSSLRFHVPRERVEGKPMIWSEFRVHNIVFALRSCVCFVLCLASMRVGTKAARAWAVLGSSIVSLGAMRAADIATSRLRADSTQSTTATMPYPPGWSAQTVSRFKLFYSYSQLMATFACNACSNLAYPFVVLLPIQLASLLMTLVRKGLISVGTYHRVYCGSLALPFVLAVHHLLRYGVADSVLMMVVAAGMLALRRRGVGKYALWVPVLAMWQGVHRLQPFASSPATFIAAAAVATAAAPR